MIYMKQMKDRKIGIAAVQQCRGKEKGVGKVGDFVVAMAPGNDRDSTGRKFELIWR